MTTPLAFLAFLMPAADGAVDYLKDVKPIFARRCYACHGALKQTSGLRVDTAAMIHKGGESGPAVETGNASESLLVQAVTGEAGFRMPPEGEPLAAAEIGKIRAWIDAGASAPQDEPPQADPRRHWAFLPPARPEIPEVCGAKTARNPIDAFLEADQFKKGVVAAPPADRATLLRRVSIDLVGLLPTRKELDSFLEDRSEFAYETVVDRLLASPQYGERWGRHWMDVWRYSDWAGFGAEIRESKPHIWRWRDWIVASLNADKGYDRMIIEMLAGDELAPEDPAVLPATGYLVRNWYKFNRNVWLQNTVDHTAKAFLGITLACARCHDHKYDPFAQADYYRFRAFFEPHEVRTDLVPNQPDETKDGVVRAFDNQLDVKTFLFVRGDEKVPDRAHPLAPQVPALWGERLAIATVPLPAEASYPSLHPYAQAALVSRAEAEIAKTQAALDAARKANDTAKAQLVVLTAQLDATPEATAKAAGAAAKAEGEAEVAEKALLSVRAELESIKARISADKARVASPSDSKKADMLALAAGRAERLAAQAKASLALTQAERAETQAKLAGKGELTALHSKVTSARSALEQAQARATKLSFHYAPIGPVYPTASSGRRLALARWISQRRNPLTARVGVNHIWMRHFGRPIVPTVFDFGLNGKPPANRALLDWLAVEFMESGWSMKALHRLIVTSAAYQRSSGGGPDDRKGAIDPDNLTLWHMNPRRMEAEVVRDNVLYAAGSLDLGMGGPELDQNAGLASRRRSLYFRHAPEKQMTFLKLFDAASTTACYRRDVSVVPQQALALVNSPLSLGQARILAGTLSRAVAPVDDCAFVSAAFETLLSRPPTTEESSVCLAYLDVQAKRLALHGGLTPFGSAPPSTILPAGDPHQRARENLVHVLINHNDFVTIR
jgi:hypothetical protein